MSLHGGLTSIHCMYICMWIVLNTREFISAYTYFRSSLSRSGSFLSISLDSPASSGVSRMSSMASNLQGGSQQTFN